MAEFRIFHWDTFEMPGEDTFLMGEADSMAEAEALVVAFYGPRLRPDGADHVEIVSAVGEVVRRYSVG